MRKVVEVPVTEKMLKWVRWRMIGFANSKIPTTLTNDEDRRRIGLLVEAALWSANRDLKYVNAEGHDFVSGNIKIEVKGKKWRQKHIHPTDVYLKFMVDDYYVNKWPDDLLCVFGFLSPDESLVWLVGWEIAGNFKNMAKFKKAGEAYQQYNKTCQNKYSTWDIAVEHLKPMDTFTQFEL